MSNIEQFRELAAAVAKEVGADDVEAALYQTGVLLLLAKLRNTLNEYELNTQLWWAHENRDNEWIEENG